MGAGMISKTRLIQTKSISSHHSLRAILYHRWFFVDAKHFLHHLNNLTQRGVRMDGFHKMGHGVFRALGGNAEPVQRLPDATVVT